MAIFFFYFDGDKLINHRLFVFVDVKKEVKTKKEEVKKMLPNEEGKSSE